MEGQICSQLEEIPKSQSKINEELFRFKDEIREEIAKSRAQHEKYMADVHSKFDILIGMVHDRLRSEGIEPPDLVGAPLDQANSNPEGPIDELIPSEDDKGNKSAIKQSIVENGNDPNEMLLLKSARKEEGIEQNNGNVDEEGVCLHLIDLQSVLGSLGDTTVHDSSKGSTKAWFEESTSGLKAVLSQNDIDHVAHKVFDEMSQSFRAVLMDEQVNDPYTNGFNFNNLTLFDPGGGRKYAPSFSKGPLISKAHGTYVNGIKGVLSSLRHSIALIDAREKHYVIGSSHFYLSIPGNHATFKLIVDSSVNSELRLERFLFDPGGRFLPQMCCDLFELNGELRDFCFTTNYDASVRVGEYYNDVFSRKYSPNSKVVTTLELDVSIQKGIIVKALSEEGSKNIYRDINSFGGNNNVKITRECGSEKLCGEATDETPENAVNLFVYIYDKQGSGRSMSKMKGMVKQLAMMQPCNELDVSAKFQLISDYMPKISSSYLEEAVQLFGDQGHEPVQEALLHIEDKEDIDSMSDDCLDVAMIGFDAMQRANSTLEDFCRSYFMFHELDVHQPQLIFKHLPLLSFTESYIYQLDNLNEKLLQLPTCYDLSHNGECDLVSKAKQNLEVRSSNPFRPLALLLEHQGLLTQRIVDEFVSGTEYWALERKLCSSLLLGMEIKIEDVMRAAHLKSFDYRVLNLVLYGLRREKVNDLHMEFLSVSEFLVEVSDDLFDYEDDVLENNFNILRMFVRIYGASTAPMMLAKCIAESEEKYTKLLESLDPELSITYRRRCEEATKEGGKIAGPSLGTWNIPSIIKDEESYRQLISRVKPTSLRGSHTQGIITDAARI